MKGNNKLELNNATVMEALQEYLDKRWNDKIREQRVISIESVSSTKTFVVTLESVEEQP